ncbi:phage holin family protein [Pseudomonas sp. 22526]|uniref:phage holin family protein n=1 Tax=Pseudomonas sp. 22526 TaxID=3453937 RepID=UPI003F8350D5
MEAALGALIVMVVGPVVKALGFSIAWSFATAGFIGVLGVEQARQLGKCWAERKVDEVG